MLLVELWCRGMWKLSGCMCWLGFLPIERVVVVRGSFPIVGSVCRPALLTLIFISTGMGERDAITAPPNCTLYSILITKHATVRALTILLMVVVLLTLSCVRWRIVIGMVMRVFVFRAMSVVMVDVFAACLRARTFPTVTGMGSRVHAEWGIDMLMGYAYSMQPYKNVVMVNFLLGLSVGASRATSV